MEFHSDQINKLGYDGDLEEVINGSANFYDLGGIKDYNYLAEGYEDYNIKLHSTSGDYVLKLFANNQLGDYSKTRRGPDVVERLVKILLSAEKMGLNTPRLIKNVDGKFIFKTGNGEMVGIAYNWIEGNTFFDLDDVPSQKELEEIIKQAVKINSISLKPVYYHDIWAVQHIHSLYEKVKPFLSKQENQMMQATLARFDKIPMNKLPKGLVHGDFTKGNIIKTKSGKPYLIDFSVTNWAPRIVDLGIIIANLMFDTKKKIPLAERVKTASDLYQKYAKLTNLELNHLYDLSLCQTAMEFLGSIWRQNFLDDKSEETKYWLRLGREGIKEALE